MRTEIEIHVDPNGKVHANVRAPGFVDEETAGNLAAEIMQHYTTAMLGRPRGALRILSRLALDDGGTEFFFVEQP